MKQLLLIRHAETDDNRRHRLQGQRDTPLSTEGRRQVLRVADALSTESIDAIWSSPLQRALDTANGIHQRHNCPLRTVPALIERSFGTLEGQPVTALQAHEARWSGDLRDLAMPQGESIRALQARARTMVHRILSANIESLLVVGHAGLFRPMIGELLDLPFDDWFHLPQHNTCIHRFRFDQNRQPVAWQLNDIAHCE